MNNNDPFDMSLITTEARLITLIASNYKNSIEQNILDALLLLISPLELPTASAVENAEDFKLKSVVLMWQSIRMAIDWTRAVISSFCDLYMLPHGLANKHFLTRHQELKSPVFDQIVELFSGDDADDKIERINRLIGCILADRINHLTILESQLCKLSIEHPQVIEVNLGIQTEDSTSSNVDTSSSTSCSLSLSTQIIHQTMDASQISQVIKKTVGGGGKKNKLKSNNAPLTPTEMMQYLNNYLHPLNPSVSAVLGYRAFPLAYSKQDLYDVFKVLSPHSSHSNGVHETSIRHKKVNFQFSSVCNLLVYTSNKADSLHKQIHLTNDQGIFDYLTKTGHSANQEITHHHHHHHHHHIESGLESFPCYMQFLYESRCFIIINK